MSENILVRYSEFFEDDGGFVKLKDDFVKLGDNLVAEANRIKKEMGSINLLDNAGMVANFEERTRKVVELSNQHKKALKDLDTAIKEHNKEIANQNKLARDEANTRRAQNTELAAELVAKKRAIDVTTAENRQKVSSIAITKADISARKEDFNAINAENRSKISAINLARAERREKEDTERQIHKEIDAYGQLSNELRKLFRETASIGAQMYMLKKAGKEATPEYQKLSRTFDTLQVEVMETDKALKTIDASLGRHQRKVGQYENSWNGLGNSINQITREFPAFTFSFQTGMLALSNNIPIVADEIKALVDENKRLIAQGKPTESVIKQIVRNLISWQTALSLAVTLGTVFADKIAIFFEKMFQSSKKVEKVDLIFKNLMDTQEEYNKMFSEQASKEIKTMEQWVRIAKNREISEKSRLRAVDNLQSRYPQYLGNLSKEKIMTDDITSAVDRLRQALNNRAKAMVIQELLIANYKEQIANQLKYSNVLKNAKETQNLYNYSTQQAIKNSKNIRLANEQDAQSLAYLRDEEGRYADAKKKSGFVQEEYNDSIRKGQLPLKETEAILTAMLLNFEKYLDVVDEGTGGTKKLVEQEKFLSNIFELRKTQLEGVIELNSSIANSDKYSADEIISAREKTYQALKDLADLERRESIKQLKIKYDEELNSDKYNKESLLELEKQYGYDLEQVKEIYNQKLLGIDREYQDLSLLEKLEYQKTFLESERKRNSESITQYEDYSRKISEIQQKIDDIINGREKLNAKDELGLSEGQLESLRGQSAELDKILNGRKFGSLNKREQKKALQELEKFQKEQVRLEQNYDLMRKQNKIAQLKDEMKSFEEGTTGRLKLQKEIADIEIQIEKDKQKEIQKAIEDEAKRQKEAQKKFLEDLNELIGQIIDRFSEAQQKKVERSEKLLEKQNDAVERQRERASNGLENTLAFEQKMLAEREAELVKQQRRQERLEKIKAIWTSYSSYATQDPQTAVQKALRDFALLEAITMSFGDGGVVEDRLPGNGIFRGQSHQGNRGGIPIMVEGKEGILSKTEMANLGKDNFYSLKHMAGMGKIDKDLFTRQRKDFDKAMFVPVSSGNDKIAKELRGVQDAILNQPTAVMKQIEAVDGVMKYVIQETTKNKTKNYIAQTKRPRM